MEITKYVVFTYSYPLLPFQGYKVFQVAKMYENYCKNCGFILFPLKELEAEQKEHQENNQFYFLSFYKL